MCTRILETSEQGLIACTLKTILKKFSAARATAYAYRANEYTLEKKNEVLTSLGFSRRCWTILRRNSAWDIWIPLMRWSCSERAKNMQFPSPWLSEKAKRFSNAVLFNVCDSSVLLDSMRASSRICWSARKVGSPVNDRRKLLKQEWGYFTSVYHNMMNWSIGKNSPQYKIAVVSKEQNNPTLQQK